MEPNWKLEMVITNLLLLLLMLISFLKMRMHVKLFVSLNFLRLTRKKIKKEKKPKQLRKKLQRIKNRDLVLKKIILLNLKFQKRVIRKDSMQVIKPLRNLKWKNLLKTPLSSKAPQNTYPN